MGRLIRGPRLIINLHRIDEVDGQGRVVLTATMTRNNRSYSWRVDSREPIDEGSKGAIRSMDDMVKELATRIHSLSPTSEDTLVRWKSWHHFNEGLKAYRDALVSTKKRLYNLKMAEKSFIRALEEKNDFALAYYNLGVVYTELGQEKAAEIAFLKAIKGDPKMVAAYYALGFSQFIEAEADLEDIKSIFVEPPERYDSCKEVFGDQVRIGELILAYLCDDKRKILIEKYEDVILLCDWVISTTEKGFNPLNRDYYRLAEAYNLKANAQSRIDMLHGKSGVRRPKYLESAENAVNYSWKSLFMAEFWNERINVSSRNVRECSIDLAYLCLYRLAIEEEAWLRKNARFKKNASDALTRSIFVDLSNANTYFILGKIYYCAAEYVKSVKAYRDALAIEPENSEFWAHLALAYARNNKTEEARDACRRVKVYESGASYQAIDIAALAYHQLLKNLEIQSPVLKERLPGRQTSDGDESLKEKKRELKESYSLMRRASQMAKTDLYLREGGLGGGRRTPDKIKYLISKLERFGTVSDSGETEHNWRYAQYAIALARLGNRLKEENPHAEDMSRALDCGIKCLERIPGPDKSKWSWEGEQNMFTLGFLYYYKYLTMVQGTRCQRDTYYSKALDYFKKVEDEEFSKKNHKHYIKGRSHILIKLGDIYLETRNFERGESCYSKAIQILEFDHPKLVMRERLHSKLARALRGQEKKKLNALKEARKCQISDPINREVGEVAGDIYFDLQKHKMALDEFYNALVWDPNNPEILKKIGLCYLDRARLCRNSSDRDRSLRKAKDNFEQAWELYDKDKLRGRAEARYLMARAYMELCDYEEALPHLSVIYKAMESKEKSISTKVLIVGIHLGMTYLKRKNFAQCERIFNNIIRVGLNYVKERNNRLKEFNIIRKYSTDGMSIARIVAWAHMGLALSFAERNTDHTLDMAFEEIRKSEYYINLLIPGDEWIKCLAMSEYCKGWIRYKQHLICDKRLAEKTGLKSQDLIDISIEHLERSVSIRADARAYLHLALACRAKSSKPAVDGEREVLIRRAKDYWKLAGELDIKGEYNKELTELKEGLVIVESGRSDQVEYEASDQPTGRPGCA
ncbi:tetratricopeptide repeat protein [Candidatus Methanocrinis natronophilus]|uniref:Tetratricopeptide repeat protein n=1 Tax=Candidatus Methanocrinis natronophilus TaxID=3033396 RepID=A0ABT5X648_9EURY|nr:tetratricopeptide repeat protein [Candidatus Methanocrinis natronophilus]MDF0590128.1 tetratricopeptide repeat protein [Candidatus Methanocrinis natronophilus]